jgi:hypothetical protein
MPDQTAHPSDQAVYAFRGDVLEAVSDKAAAAMRGFATSIAHAEGILREYHASQHAGVGVESSANLDGIRHNARLVFTMSWAKAVLYSRGVIDGVNSGNILAALLCLRAYVEMAATLRYTVEEMRPIVGRCVAAGRVTGEDCARLVERFDLLLHGGRFDWRTYFFEGPAAIAEKRKRPKRKEDRTAFETKHLRVGDCIKKWSGVRPEVGFIYDYLCDTVHPNKGSNLVLLRERDGGVFFDVRGEGRMGLLILERILPYAASLCSEVMSEITLFVASLGADDETVEIRPQ